MKQLKHLTLLVAALLCFMVVVSPTLALADPVPKNKLLVNGIALSTSTPQGVSYNETSGTLTLNNFKGESIVVEDYSNPYILYIELKGRNVLSTSGCIANTSGTNIALAGFYSGSNGGTSFIIKSSEQGSLTINRTFKNNDPFANRVFVGMWAGGDIIVAESAQLTINMWSYDYEHPAKIEAIHSTSGGLLVYDRAQLHIFASAPNATYARGVRLGVGNQLFMNSTKRQLIDLSSVNCDDTAGLEVQNTDVNSTIYLSTVPELIIRADGVLKRGIGGASFLPDLEAGGYDYSTWAGEIHYINNYRGMGGCAWTRLWGNSALDTMAKIVGTGSLTAYGNAFDQVGGTVVIATDSGYKDALAATALAGLDGGPVLLTNKSKLSAQTKKELQRLKPSRVYIAGGTSVVTKAVENEIKSVTGVIPVRAAGQNALLTAVDIYDKGKGRWGKYCIVATTKSYKDALSIAPYAYAKHAPIFLTNPDKMDQKTFDRIVNGGFDIVRIMGGPNAVSDSIRIKLSQHLPVVRYGGVNALDTSGIIATSSLLDGMGIDYLGIATAGNFKDALTGAAFCGRNNSPIALVGTGKTDLPGQCTAIEQATSVTDKTWIDHAYVFGGTSAISAETFSYILDTFCPGVG